MTDRRHVSKGSEWSKWGVCALLVAPVVVAGCGSSVRLDGGNGRGGGGGGGGGGVTTVSATVTSGTSSGSSTGSGGGEQGGVPEALDNLDAAPSEIIDMAVAPSGDQIVLAGSHYAWSSEPQEPVTIPIVTALSPDGGLQWQLGPEVSLWGQVNAVVRSGDGSYFIAGGFEQSIDFGTVQLSSVGDAIFIAELSSDGQVLWARSVHDEQDTGAPALAVDASGDVLLAAVMGGMVSTDQQQPLLNTGGVPAGVLMKLSGSSGDVLWSGVTGHDAAGGLALAVDAAGHSYVGGVLNGSSPLGGVSSGPDPQLFALKVTPDGSAMWSSLLGQTSGVTVTAIAAAPGGAVMMGGVMNGSADVGNAQLLADDDDIFLVSLTSGGAPTSAQVFNSEGVDELSDLVIDLAGDVVAVGSFTLELSLGEPPLAAGFDVQFGGVDPSSHAFFAKLSISGEHLWSHKLDSPFSSDPTSASAAAVDEQNRIYATGTYEGTITLGVLSLFSDEGAFVVRLTP